MMKILYNIFFSVFALLYLPSFYFKGKSAAGLGSRLGRIPEETRAQLEGKEILWVHAVSVGEVALAIRLLTDWRERFPGKKFVLTVTTVAGREVAQRQISPADILLWYPVDFAFSVRRFIGTLKPQAVVILETEIWPNLLWELSRKKIPVFIFNGRISDRAYPKYLRIRSFMRPILNLFSGIGVQDETMRRRFEALGAEPSRLAVTGNIKFDWQPPKAVSEEAITVIRTHRQPSHFLMLAVSTHAGEEEILFDLYKNKIKENPNFRLFIAPRHLSRISAIEAAAAKSGVEMKSVFSDPNNRYDEGIQCPVLIVDRMGVLPAFYEAADLVFVGGSLVPVGGHNPVEPAYYRKPILVGPYMQNFEEMTRAFLEAGAITQITRSADLAQVTQGFMSDPVKCSAAGEAAKSFVQREGGAILKNTQTFLSEGIFKK